MRAKSSAGTLLAGFRLRRDTEIQRDADATKTAWARPGYYVDVVTPRRKGNASILSKHGRRSEC